MLQRSPEWFAARLGCATASRIIDVMAEPTAAARKADPRAEAVTRRNYKRELALERFSGVPQESGYTSFAMAQGIAKEDAARDAYSFAKGVDVEQAGFIPHPTIDHAGASPDGLVGERGLVELKAPEANAMFEMLVRGPLDRRYVLQAQWQLACTGRDWCDVVFFREGCPLEIVMLGRDTEHIRTLENAVTQFLAEVEEDYQTLCRIHRR